MKDYLLTIKQTNVYLKGELNGTKNRNSKSFCCKTTGQA